MFSDIFRSIIFIFFIFFNLRIKMYYNFFSWLLLESYFWMFSEPPESGINILKKS